MGMLHRFFLGVTTLVCCAATLRAAAIDVIPSAEFAQYGLVYNLDIPVSSPGWNTAGVLTGASGYSINNAASIPQGSFSRVAYYMELSGATNPNYPNGYVWVSFDAAGFTDRADRLGVPTTPSGGSFQQNITNLNIFSNVASIVTGTGIMTGNVEFWPSNYTQARPAVSPANASGTAYDFGDTRNTGSGHASMQIHNYDINGADPGAVGQTLFAYNAWGSVRVSELGIGNNPNTAQAPDYTLTANADDVGAWTVRTLQVFVAPIPEPGTISVLVLSGVGLLILRRRC